MFDIINENRYKEFMAVYLLFLYYVALNNRLFTSHSLILPNY